MPLKREPRLLLLALLLGWSISARADVVVVVHPKNPLNSISKDQVSNLFLGRTSSFPNGAPAKPIELPDTEPAFIAFHAKFTEMKPSRLKAHWSKLVFSMRVMPPREVSSAVEVRQLVAADPNAIGYLDQSEVEASVKVLLK